MCDTILPADLPSPYGDTPFDGIDPAKSSDRQTQNSDMSPSQIELVATPNPFSDIVTVQWSTNVRPGGIETNAIIQVYSAMGQPLDQVQMDLLPGSSVRLDLSALPSGMYIVRVQLEGADKSIKIIKS